MKFRLLTGTNQRWAYISMQAPYGERQPQGWAQNSEEEADAALQDVIAKTFYSVHRIDLIKGWKRTKEAEVAAAAVV